MEYCFAESVKKIITRERQHDATGGKCDCF